MKRSISVTLVLAAVLAVTARAQNTPAAANPQVLTVDFVAFGANGAPVLDLKAEEVTVRIGSREVPLRRTYADVATGEAVALVGSSGLIEVAVRDGNAAHTLDLKRGSVVRIRDVGRDPTQS